MLTCARKLGHVTISIRYSCKMYKNHEGVFPFNVHVEHEAEEGLWSEYIEDTFRIKK